MVEYFGTSAGSILVDIPAGRNTVFGKDWLLSWVVGRNTVVLAAVAVVPTAHPLVAFPCCLLDVAFESDSLCLVLLDVRHLCCHEHGLFREFEPDVIPVGLGYRNDPFGSSPWFASSAAPNVT